MRNAKTSSAVILSNHGRMAIDIKLLLAGDPLLLLWREGCIECFDCGGILTAISGGTGDVHPVFTFQRPGNQFCHQQGGGEITGNNKADILLFAADKSAADIVARIAEIDVHIVAHFAHNFKAAQYDVCQGTSGGQNAGRKRYAPPFANQDTTLLPHPKSASAALQKGFVLL